jgi:hypothetical protein
MKIRITLFLLLFICFSLVAQDTWLMTYYPFAGSYYVSEIIVCTDSGYVINGYYSNGSGEDLVIVGFVLKTDPEGNMLWAQNYNITTGLWEHHYIVETEDNGFIITGYNYGSGSDMELTKLDSEGNFVWEDVFENYSVFCLDKTSDGNLLAAGIDREEDYNWPILKKLTQDTDVIWSQTYAFENYVYGKVTSAIQANDGGYILAGFLSASPQDRDTFVIKTNAEGDSLWARIYGNADTKEEPIAIIEDDEANILVSGYIQYTSGVLWKLDEQGNTIWFYETPEEIHSSFSKSNDGSIISLSGWGSGNNQINKFNNDYENIWTQDFGILAGYSDKALSTTADDHIVVAVYPDNVPGIAKLNSEGTFTDSQDEFSIISTTNLSNFPNPFNPSTTINFSIKKNSKVALSVYNIKGQLIKTLSNEVLNAGDHSIIWNGEDEYNVPVSSGIYLYKLIINGENKAINKCLLLK